MAQSTNPRRESPGFEESPFPSRKCDEDIDIKQILIRNETLLWDLRAQRDTETSRQLELLQAIRDELVSQTTPLHLICNAVLQWLLVATGIIFGMFAIAGTGLQNNGNFLAKMQNQMNLVTFCQANNSSIYAHPCEEILQKGPSTIAWLADQTFPKNSLGADWPWKDDNLSMFKQPYSWYYWIIPPVVTGLAATLLTWRLYRKKFGKKKDSNSQLSKSEPDINSH
ncbi:hypothetical protein BGZ57DRAFT_988448 [Hyaloscypha finlandica]|nr:hypothetical protein BGZ57DRAFT_988448 [Hyaloscypha finlandica]